MDFKTFDQRNYKTVQPQTGYGEWADTYEEAVPDLLDIKTLETIVTVPWMKKTECLDLGCGTGRIAAWLGGRKGITAIDGIDLTPEMLQRAKDKDIYRTLSVGSVEETGLSSNKYDLLTMSLVDEHLPSLSRVYQEAHRLSIRSGHFVVVGMHPFFFMNGMPTHFNDKSGSPKAIETHIHLVSDHIRAAFGAGWKLEEFCEGVVDQQWIEIKPKWEKFLNFPISYGYVWSRSDRGD